MTGGVTREEGLEQEFRVRHPDGPIRWVLSRGHTHFDAAGRPLRQAGIAVEMTRQRQLEDQLRKSRRWKRWAS